MGTDHKPSFTLQGAPYALTVFLSAFLLFEVQPFIAKYILPWFGGAPAVWTTCMLFFQVLLLGGYAYAHLLNSRLAPRLQMWVHLWVLLASTLLLLVLSRRWATPLTPGPDWRPQGSENPVLHIMAILAAGVGLPYLILSTTGPLLQSWFGRKFPGVSPYPLYALSNFGSLLALVGYPFLIEWLLPIQAQGRTWSWFYFGFAVCCGACALMLPASVRQDSALNTLQANPGAPVPGAAQPHPPPREDRILWLALASCGSILLLATTNQLCLGVAVVPFLWVLPLALYLLSFILCFQSERWYRRGVFQPLFGIGAAMGCFALYRQATLSLPLQIAIHSLVLFAGCMVCHGELVRRKPEPQYLTSFYLLVAAGGALGGAFVSLLAPYLFRGYWEYHLGLWLALLLMFLVLWRDPDSWLHRGRPWLPILISLAACVFPVVLAMVIDTHRVVKDWRPPLMAILAAALMVKVAFQRRPEADPGSATLAQMCVGVSLAVLGGALAVHLRNTNVLTVRNFYGVLSVAEPTEDDPAWRTRSLSHGPILHGFQFLDPAKARYPTSYYGRLSGIGIILLNHPRRRAEQAEDRHLRIGVVGLGVGTIATYGEPGDTIRFYEINPEVYRLASSEYFSYLKDSPARVDVTLGDARLSMEQELARGEPQQFDVLVLDAFSGDAIPLHLLTGEAFAIYLQHLRKPGGLLAVHISNRFVDLRPVLWNVAEHFSLHPAWFHAPNDGRVAGQADWVILAPNRAVLDVPAVAKAIQPIQFFGNRTPFWTDDYSNLIRVLKK